MHTLLQQPKQTKTSVSNFSAHVDDSTNYWTLGYSTSLPYPYGSLPQLSDPLPKSHVEPCYYQFSTLNTPLSQHHFLFCSLSHSRNPSSQFFSQEIPTILGLYPLNHLDFMNHDSLLSQCKTQPQQICPFTECSWTLAKTLNLVKSHSPLTPCLQINR